jgi:hypothetical protein
MNPSRFKETFRERMPEWVTSAGMLVWGLLAIFAVGLFEKMPLFHPLLLVMTQFKWGLITTSIGSIRLLFLVINGAWRPSAHVRAIGCGFGCMLWGSLTVSALQLDWILTTTAVYITLMAIEFFSLGFAAGDAKIADLSAKGGGDT